MHLIDTVSNPETTYEYRGGERKWRYMEEERDSYHCC